MTEASFTVLRCTECGQEFLGGSGCVPCTGGKLVSKQAVFLDDVVEALDAGGWTYAVDLIQDTFGREAA